MYIPKNSSPSDYGIPHNAWRVNQREAINMIEQDNKNNIFFMEAPTGFGKSVISTMLGRETPVLAIAHSLALLDAYRDNYGFEIIKGRQEYLCILDSKIESWYRAFKIFPTATDCHFSPMMKCPQSSICPYIMQKHRALYAQRAACTYRYLGVSRLFKERSGHLVFDEAHDAAEELIRFNEFSVQLKTISKYKLPKFPFPYYGDNNKGAILSKKHQETIMIWLENCVSRLMISDHQAISGLGAKIRKLHDRLNKFLESIVTTNWFLEIDGGNIVFRALSAENIVRQIFAGKKTKLLMSATIGNPKPLADIMGIEEHKSYSFPHPVPARYRPIEILDIDRLTARNLKERPHLYSEQAHKIYNWIEKLPPSWRGIILTTSYKKIEKLAELLADKYFEKRRVIIQGHDQKLSNLIARFITDPERGDIAIGTIQGWGTGLDLQGELARWIVIAGVPHVNPTDEYMKARRGIAGGANYQRWLTYNAVMQACGRVSRGERDEIGWISNYALLADGSAFSPTAKKYYGDWFRSAFIGEE